MKKIFFLALLFFATHLHAAPWFEHLSPHPGQETFNRMVLQIVDNDIEAFTAELNADPQMSWLNWGIVNFRWSWLPCYIANIPPEQQPENSDEWTLLQVHHKLFLREKRQNLLRY
jgi:hypothetical protein